ncbi:hypothetical protein [Chromobacterium haemolyticum]|uniref:hypothetical protein n=1 Tax=Chromobacterium haemolyticum TaxID=394935 RepID=UPI0009DAC790|nr:hypothetical protein [Chromobacterium haemolyticum]OQS42905.1 hypothetical protein B0T39_04610 [Chromobacterium haemolyticum]
MNAAKQIGRMMVSGENPYQAQVLKELALALYLKQPFDIDSLYQIDSTYFDVAVALINEWRFDHYIAARSELLGQLLRQPQLERAPQE